MKKEYTHMQRAEVIARAMPPDARRLFIGLRINGEAAPNREYSDRLAAAKDWIADRGLVEGLDKTRLGMSVKFAALRLESTGRVERKSA